MCTLIILYNLFWNAHVVAMHNRYTTRTVEYPPKITRSKYLVYSPLDATSGGTWVGFNEKGLYAAVTDQHSDGEKIVRKSRGKLVLNVLGRFSNASEATEYLKEEVRKGYRKGNFVLLDEDNGFHVIYDTDVEVREMEKCIHVITNLTPLPGMEFSPLVKVILERAETRKKRALDLTKKINTNDLGGALRMLRKIAADHGEGKSGRSICYHETGGWKMTSSTIMAVKKNIERSRVLYCKGNPCQSEFLDYSHLLKSKRKSPKTKKIFRESKG